MKLLLLSLALLGLALSQECDVADVWSFYQTGGDFDDGLWADQEIVAWGMDGGNKWNDFWLRTASSSVQSRYSRVTCAEQTGASQGLLPTYQSICSCSVVGGCTCYPFVDVDSPGIVSEVENGNPPFEVMDPNDNAANCAQHKPEYVYYYTKQLRIQSGGTYQQSYGIKRAFTPSDAAWEEFCDNAYSDTSSCFVPSNSGGSSASSIVGAHFSYNSGTWRDSGNDIVFFTDKTQSGCHYKTHNHRWPSAHYCGEDAGWKYGYGTTLNVRFGCDRGFFADTDDTDVLHDIDDTDCGSVYVAFDELSPLHLIANDYEYYPLAPTASSGGVSSHCWLVSDLSFTDHRKSIPSYRTPCSASGLAVPFFAVLGSLLMIVLRNF